MPPREIEQLTQVNVELIQAIRQLIEQERQAGLRNAALDARAGIGPYGNVQVGPGLPNSFFDQDMAKNFQGASFWSQQDVQGALGAGATGMSAAGMSFMRTASAGFGPTVGAAGAFGASILTGNPAAIGASAGNLAASAVKESMGPFFAAADVLSQGPREGNPFLDEDFLNKRAKLEARVAFSKSSQENIAFRTGVRLAYGEQGVQAFDREMQRTIRYQRGQLDQFDSVEQATANRVKGFFAPLAEGGKQVQQRDVDAMVDFYRPIAEAQFQNNKMIDERTSFMIMHPGNSKPAR